MSIEIKENNLYKKMRHKLWLNQVQGFAYMQLVGGLSQEELSQLFARLGNVFTGQDSHNLLIDLRLSPGTVPPKKLRDIFHEKAGLIGFDRVAVLGADPASRMTFKILMSMLNKSRDTLFCNTEGQALSWLKKGRL